MVVTAARQKQLDLGLNILIWEMLPDQVTLSPTAVFLLHNIYSLKAHSMWWLSNCEVATKRNFLKLLETITVATGLLHCTTHAHSQNTHPHPVWHYGKILYIKYYNNSIIDETETKP